MLKRVLSTIVAAPILIVFILLGGVYLEVGCALISIIGLHEFYAAFGNKEIYPITWIGYVATIFLYIGLHYNWDFTILAVMALVIFAMMIYNTFGNKNHLIGIAATVLGLAYITFLLYHTVLIARQDSQFFVWYIFILAWVTDTCAYFVGVSIGKTPLAPTVSPKKTVEGVVGGIVGCTIISSLYAYFFKPEFLVFAIFLGVFGSVVGVLGDLTASKIKRQLEVKDFGKIMPGHGGVLDRFDSILFTAPLVYYAMLIFYAVQK